MRLFEAAISDRKGYQSEHFLNIKDVDPLKKYLGQQASFEDVKWILHETDIQESDIQNLARPLNLRLYNYFFIHNGLIGLGIKTSKAIADRQWRDVRKKGLMSHAVTEGEVNRNMVNTENSYHYCIFQEYWR